MRAAVAFVIAIGALAQQPARVEFDVVSIKMGDPADPGSSAHSSPGRTEIRNSTLKNLVRGAYSLNEYQLEGGAGWMDTARFNIDAKFPAGTPLEQRLRMMQSMLADRFHLEFHRVTKTLSEYALVVAKGGPKLTASGEGEYGSSQGPRQIKGKGLQTSDLARMLISVVGAPVIDRTGLTGKYNVSLAFVPLLDSPRENETLPTIFAALQEQLGLRLESIKGPVEVVVIDKAERPTEN